MDLDTVLDLDLDLDLDTDMDMHSIGYKYLIECVYSTNFLPVLLNIDPLGNCLNIRWQFPDPQIESLPLSNCQDCVGDRQCSKAE